MASAAPDRIPGMDFRGFGSALSGLNNPHIETAAVRFGEAALAAGRRRIISAGSRARGEANIVDIYTFRDPSLRVSDEALTEYNLALKGLRHLLEGQKTLVVHTSSNAYRSGESTEWLSIADTILDSRILWATQDQL